MNAKRNPLRDCSFQGASQEQNARLYYSMVNANENKNSSNNDEEFEDRRNHDDYAMSDEELEALLDDLFDDEDDDEQARKPVEVKQLKAEPPALSSAGENPKLSPPDPSYFYELAKQGKYDDKARELFREFAELSSKQGIPPIERGYLTFKYSKNAKFVNEFEKYEQAEEYTNDLRTHDLQWIQVTHPDHETKKKVLHGIYDGIFNRGEFNWDQAYSIAESFYHSDYGEDKDGFLSDDNKVKHLRLPQDWQKQLAILRSSKIRNGDWKANADARAAQKEELSRIDAIDVESIAIREKLESDPKMKTIDMYVDIWKAYMLTGGDWSRLAAIRKCYEELSGLKISKSLLQRKRDLLRKKLERLGR